MKGVIVIDVEKCLACKTCEIECALAHSKSGSLSESIREHPLPQPRMRVEKAENFSIPLQCRHCEDAPCLSVCPTGAIEKMGAEGPVVIKDSLCIGCKLCILACPFGVLRMDREGKAVIKCDLCIERLERGQVPACVQSCPTHAIQYKSIDEITAEVRKKAGEDVLVVYRRGENGRDES